MSGAVPSPDREPEPATDREPEPANESGFKFPGKADRRHPLVVTTERLADHQATYADHITPAEQKQLAQLGELVDRIHRRVSGGDPS